jgi:hypothetical protein
MFIARVAYREGTNGESLHNRRRWAATPIGIGIAERENQVDRIVHRESGRNRFVRKIGHAALQTEHERQGIRGGRTGRPHVR